MIDTQPFAMPSSTPATEAPNSAGDVFADQLFLTTVNGLDIDLKNFNMQLDLYEDIFSNVMMGSLVLVDAAGILHKAPFVGGEFLTLQMRTPGFTTNDDDVIRKTFAVYAVSDLILDNDRQSFFTVYFISIEGIQDNVNMLSRSFSGRTDEIVTNIYTNYIKAQRLYQGGKFSGDTELAISGGPHSTQLKFIAPYWTPLKAINWVAARSIGVKNKAPNFLFFESNKRFYFSSIEDLIETRRNKGSLFSQYFYSQANIRDEIGAFTYRRPNIARQYQVVTRQRAPKLFNLLEAQDSGYLASTFYTHDITLKQYKEWAWDYPTNFDNFNHLESFNVSGNNVLSAPAGKRPFHSKVLRNTESHRTIRTKHFRMNDGQADQRLQDWSPPRTSLLQELSNIRLELDVMGRTDVEVGQLIYYHFPNSTDKELNDPEPTNPVLSGLYLISAIRHTFTPGKHAMRLEVVKDSFHTAVG